LTGLDVFWRTSPFSSSSFSSAKSKAHVSLASSFMWTSEASVLCLDFFLWLIYGEGDLDLLAFSDRMDETLWLSEDRRCFALFLGSCGKTKL
jgi:hypothetical protein